jgi:iron complex outermembrane receptor protein
MVVSRDGTSPALPGRGRSLGARSFRAFGLALFAAVAWPSRARADGEAGSSVEVRVRGVRRPRVRAPKDTTVAGSVVSREELSSPGLRVGEILRAQVGVQVNETGGPGAPATASIRGATAAQLPVYLAGVCLNDDVGGAADLSRIPLWLIDRVEIYRGNAPFEADRLGMGGAIFFEPRWPGANGAPASAGAGAMLGSFGARGTWGYASVGGPDGAVLAGVSAEATRNDYPYVDDHGTLLVPTGSTVERMSNAQVETYDAWVLGRARMGEGRAVDAFANVTSRDQGVPTLSLVPSREASATFDRGIGGARAVVALDSTGVASLEARSSVSVVHAVYNDPLYELFLQTRRLTLDGARVEEHLGLDVAATDTLTVRGAVDASSETLARDDEDTPSLRARRLASRAALTARQWFGDAFSVQALAAAQCDGISTTTISTCNLFAPTGRLGASWTDVAWEAYANVGRYVRTPTLGELYGVSVLVHGNPSLLQESGVSADGGLRWTGRPTGESRPPWAIVGVFSRWTTDLVSYVRSAEGVVPINVGSARFAGVEAQLGAGFLRWLQADVAATFLDPRDTTPARLVVNDILPFQSRLVLVPRLAAEWRELHAHVGPFRRLRAEVRWVYQASRYADTAGLAVIPAQNSLDAELLARTSDEHFTLRVRASDLLDTPRFDVVGFPLPGRSAFASLEETW